MKSTRTPYIGCDTDEVNVGVVTEFSFLAVTIR
jgi:hypothetical protein